MHDGEGCDEASKRKQSQVHQRHWQILGRVEISKRVAIPEGAHIDLHALKLETLILVEDQCLVAVLVQRQILERLQPEWSV